MDYSEKLETLEQRIAAARIATQSAASESRDELKQRIDKAQDEADDAASTTEQKAHQATDGARGTWAQMKANVATKTGDAKAKLDERNRQMDSKVAAREADFAEEQAAEAIDFAVWAIVNAEVAVLDAIDARLHADMRAETANV